MMEKQSEILNIQTHEEDSKILRENIIDYIVMKAMDSDFKNQQKDQTKLTPDERRKIVENMLNNNHLTFLYLFGEYLIEDHLEYFKSKNVNNYEINFHLHRLSRMINSKKVYNIIYIIDILNYYNY